MRFAWFLLILFSLKLQAQSPGPYAPAAGQTGSSAIHKDSSLISAWADSVSIHRGYLDIAQKNLGFASHGQEIDALNYADGSVVSLGDSGLAEFYFSSPIINLAGPEFAIFENSFSDVFLEFAFVEASQDGQLYFRFPAVSLLDTMLQTGSFGASETSLVHNLAGKYRADYGQPFDLAELPIDSVHYIRIVDVIGSIDPLYALRDSQGRIINDPYPTAFASGGFDLDALALLAPNSLSADGEQINRIQAYPNPATERVTVDNALQLKLYNSAGTLLASCTNASMDLSKFPAGYYYLEATLSDRSRLIEKLIIL